MHEYFEGIAWWMSREGDPSRSISMKDLEEGLKGYNDHMAAEAAASGGKARKVAAGRATLYRKFPSVDNALIRTRQYLLDEGRRVPRNLEEYLAVGIKESSRDQHIRVFNNDASADEIEQWIERARVARDDSQLVSLLEHLAARKLREADQKGEEEKVQYLKEAFGAAKEGYAVADESPSRSRSKRIRHEQMLCARSAAWAAVQQSRLSVEKSSESESDKHLMISSIWKRNESECARDLGLPVTAEVALFHANRAMALIQDDLDQSVIGLRDISRYLIARAGGHGSNVNDRVRYHDLTSIIQRLCALDWASSSDARCQTLVHKHFPDDIGHTIGQLQRLYANEGRGREARDDGQVLLRIKDMNDELLHAYGRAETSPGSVLLTGVDGQQLHVPGPAELSSIISAVEPWDFLRIQEHKALHAVALTRYAIAVHDIGSHDSDKNSKLPPAEQLLATAENLCRTAHRFTRPRTVDAVLLKRVDSARSEIERRLTPMRWEEIMKGREGFDFVSHAIRELRVLLWKSTTSNPITYDKAVELAPIVRTISRYLTDSGTAVQTGIDPSPA